MDGSEKIQKNQVLTNVYRVDFQFLQNTRMMNQKIKTFTEAVLIV